jgi:hypothetical protein
MPSVKPEYAYQFECHLYNLTNPFHNFRINTLPFNTTLITTSVSDPVD